MANGDTGASEGMDVVPAVAYVKDGYDEINKTRDYATRQYMGITVADDAPAPVRLHHIWLKPIA